MTAARYVVVRIGNGKVHLYVTGIRKTYCGRMPGLADMPFEAEADRITCSRCTRAAREGAVEERVEQRRATHFPGIDLTPAGYWQAVCPCGWTGEPRNMKQWAVHDRDEHERTMS